jgi:hypothetical protein
VKTRKELSEKKICKWDGRLVDQAKPGGCGTSDDGNRARRFFNTLNVKLNPICHLLALLGARLIFHVSRIRVKDPSHSVCISGFCEMLIRRCAVTLQTLSSGHAVNIEACDKHVKETAGLMVAEYRWYGMPASVHNVLLHAAQVTAEASLPIGQLSEEAQDSLHEKLQACRRVL